MGATFVVVANAIFFEWGIYSAIDQWSDLRAGRVIVTLSRASRRANMLTALTVMIARVAFPFVWAYIFAVHRIEPLGFIVGFATLLALLRPRELRGDESPVKEVQPAREMEPAEEVQPGKTQRLRDLVFRIFGFMLRGGASVTIAGFVLPIGERTEVGAVLAYPFLGLSAARVTRYVEKRRPPAVKRPRWMRRIHAYVLGDIPQFWAEEGDPR